MSRGCELVADPRQLRLDVGDGRRARRRPCAAKSSTTPGAKNHSSGSSSIVCAALAADRRVVVPGRVHVGGVVRAEARELLGRPALAVAQQLAAGRRAAPRCRAAPARVAGRRCRCAAAPASPAGSARSARRDRRTRHGGEPTHRGVRWAGSPCRENYAAGAGVAAGASASRRLGIFSAPKTNSDEDAEPDARPAASRCRSRCRTARSARPCTTRSARC